MRTGEEQLYTALNAIQRIRIDLGGKRAKRSTNRVIQNLGRLE